MTSEIKTEAARDAAKLLSEVWPVGIPVDPIVVARRAGLQVLETATLDKNILGACLCPRTKCGSWPRRTWAI